MNTAEEDEGGLELAELPLVSNPARYASHYEFQPPPPTSVTLFYYSMYIQYHHLPITNKQYYYCLYNMSA